MIVDDSYILGPEIQGQDCVIGGGWNLCFSHLNYRANWAALRGQKGERGYMTIYQ